MKKITSLLLAALLTVGLFSGCGSEPAANDTESSESETRTVTVTDMSGDEVTVEGEVEKIVNLWPAGTSSFFVMGAGELIEALAVNTPATMNAWTKHFYADSVNIPAMSGTTPSVEEIISMEPDLVIVHPSSAKEGFAQQIRDAGIPAININFSNYETMVKAYTMLGDILGGEYEQKLDNWCKEVSELSEKSKKLTKDIAEEDKPVVFYIAGQNDSLTTTMSSGSIVEDWVNISGGIYAPVIMNLEGTEATEEAIFELNPDIIIVGGTNQHILLDKIAKLDGWKDLKAVKNGKVYRNPYGCFNWDRFGLESRLQIEYALMCIHPEIAETNGINRDYMINRVIEFYKTYNGTVLTETEAGYMLDGLQPDGTQEIPVV